MGRDLGDVIARARGLATRFLAPAALDELRAAPDVRALSARLVAAGVVDADTPAQAPALDHALRRHAAARLHVLRRWAGDRAAALAIVLDDEDRRSLRTLARGCADGAPVERRLAGLIPTAVLPERALRELAHQTGLGAMAGLLAAWRNPYADALRAARDSEVPDLGRIESAISRRFFARAAAGARGDTDLAAYLAALVDLENAWAALALAGDPGGTDGAESADLFLDGGAVLDAPAFRRAAGAASVTAARDALADAFVDAPLRAVFDPGETEPERAALELLIVHFGRRRRLAPLASAAVIEFALLLRRETILVAETLWTVALAGVEVGA